MIFPAISIRQPWAWAILHAGKDVENRTWDLPRRYLGKKVLIHTGKQVDQEGIIHLHHLGYSPPGTLETGGIVGVTVFCGGGLDSSNSAWAEPGLFHWEMVRISTMTMPFHRCAGRLGFFSVDLPVPGTKEA